VKYNTLITGGLGFLGSQLVKTLADQHFRITVIDGCLENTGSNLRNRIEHPNVEYILTKIEDIKELQALIDSHEVIIDCMGWTSHAEAFANPTYDLELNLLSHLHLIKHLDKHHKVIYLGSRGQYGKCDGTEIFEETALLPIDVQGIHKNAAEGYFRIYSQRQGFSIVSLRLPNCFGPFMKLSGNDIGLIGSMIKDAMASKTISVYGTHRMRSVVYAPDLASIISKLILKDWAAGFTAYNINGTTIPIHTLASEIIRIYGKGGIQIEEVPEELKALDSGNEKLNEKKIKSVLGELNITPLHTALTTTITQLKERYDFQM